MPRKLFLLGCFVFAAAIILSSCDKKAVFQNYVRLPGGNWHKDSLVVFTVEITDTTQFNNLYFNIRNNVGYDFSNLWLFFSITPPRGEALADTVDISLAAPDGKWLGRGTGKYRDNQILFRRNIYFPHKGEYKFQIGQGMRADVLKGISDVGIRIEKVR